MARAIQMRPFSSVTTSSVRIAEDQASWTKEKTAQIKAERIANLELSPLIQN
ncbi:hypothetical protein [Methylobacterium sp. 77]|uniref:hypothetical protein n=1 Tax=Methylobacterium sp. 77 TaxID=1101192 RepID=UPI00038242C2|nr:hypothetical protein [Methylobacterium sp. 77]